MQRSKRRRAGAVQSVRSAEEHRVRASSLIELVRLFEGGTVMRYFAMLLALCAAGAGTFGQDKSPATPPKELPKLESFSTANTDAGVNPCDDFFEYTNGKWIAAHPIPADQVMWGVGSPLELWNETVLVKTLEQVSAEDAKRTPNEQKVGDYYFACMDTKTIDAHAEEWLKPELERIAAIKSKQEIAEEVAHLHLTIPGAWDGEANQTDAALLGYSGQPDFADASHNVAGIDQGGMGLPARSFYLEQDDKSKEIRAKYEKHVTNIFALAGEKPEQAKSDSTTVMAIETELAKAAMDPVARRDPKNLNNPMTLAQVKALTPSFDWDDYLKQVKSPATPKIIVTSPDFFKSLEGMLKTHSLEEWKTYLRWQMLHGNASALSDGFVKENFDFYGRTLSGAQELQPRWRRCTRTVDVNLGEALGEVYVKRAFPAENKARVLQMVKDIEAALAKDIEAAEWMAPETKKQAQLKLNAVMNKIGYPDHWRDYSSMPVVRTGYLENRQRAAGFEIERWVYKIGQPLDRAEWTMTPPTIDAYEDAQNNTINFPAGILQPPYFEASQDAAVNYGASGAVIGHETIHGLDDEGRKFDAKGDLH